MGGMGRYRWLAAAANRVMQIQPPFFPVALNRALGYAAHRGDLGEGETAEELQIDDLRQPRLGLGELVERVADHDERLWIADAVGVVDPERRDLEEPAALLRAPPPHVVDDQPAHDAGGVGHEAR